MQTSAETFLAERQVLATYRPEAEVLAGIAVPVHMLASKQSRPFFQQAAHRLAERLHVPVTWTPGTHTPYHDHPLERSRRFYETYFEFDPATAAHYPDGTVIYPEARSRRTASCGSRRSSPAVRQLRTSPGIFVAKPLVKIAENRLRRGG